MSMYILRLTYLFQNVVIFSINICLIISIVNMPIAILKLMSYYNTVHFLIQRRRQKNGVDFSANQIFLGGRNELVDNSIWYQPSVRNRSPGDEDGAHQGIVSLKCF